MFSIKQNFSGAAAAQLSAQWQFMSTLSNQMLQGTQQMVALNVSAGKAALEQASASAKQLCGAKDPQEFFALSARQSQPGLVNFITYSRQLCAIASGAHAQLMQAANINRAPASPPKAVDRVPSEITTMVSKPALKATLAAAQPVPPVLVKAPPLRSVKSAHRSKPAATIKLATPLTNMTPPLATPAPVAVKPAGGLAKHGKTSQVKSRGKK